MDADCFLVFCVLSHLYVFLDKDNLSNKGAYHGAHEGSYFLSTKHIINSKWFNNLRGKKNIPL